MLRSPKRTPKRKPRRGLRRALTPAMNSPKGNTSVTRVSMPSLQRLIVAAIAVLLLEGMQKMLTLEDLNHSKTIASKDNRVPWTPSDVSTVMRKNETPEARAPNEDPPSNQAPQVPSQTGNARTPDILVCDTPPSHGPEGSMGFQALTKIKIFSVSQHVQSHQPRLLCVVLTDSTHHATTLPAILETYAPHCDGFLAASNASDPNLQAVDLSVKNDDSTWKHLLQVLAYVSEKHKQDYDAFHFGSQNMYVIPENLRRLVTTYPQFTRNEEPVYLGGAVVASRKQPKVRHCGGGAGFTLNRRALQLAGDLEKCARIPSYVNGSFPVDQHLSFCLHELGKVQCTKSVGENSALRYLEYGVDYHARFNKKTKRSPIKVKPLAEHHGIYIRSGLDGIANDTVSMNLVDHRETQAQAFAATPVFAMAYTMRRIHAILRGHCRPVWDDPPVTALGTTGQSGYIHDATYLQSHVPRWTPRPPKSNASVCDLKLGSDVEGPNGIKGLQKIRIHDEDTTLPKVLCMIYTHSERHHLLRAIAETYGPKCDGFFGASNLTDPSIGAVHLQHEGPESYKNMWSKVRAMWRYAYQHYLEEYDFFHIGGDDHFLIPENLRYMARTGSWKRPWDPSKPLFLGGPMIDYPMTQIRYCGGGSGYTLNRVAVKLLVEELFDTPDCRPHHEASDEDRIISNCFRSVGVQCSDTNDARNETRYHQATAEFHASWTRDKPSVWHADDLQAHHGIASKERLGQISETSVSFHLKEQVSSAGDLGIRRYHAILHGLCGR